MDKVYAVQGGTGSLGLGLALRLARSGRRVIIGSRRPEKAQNAAVRAREILAENGAAAIDLRAEENSAAKAADVVAVTVLCAQQEALLWEVASICKARSSSMPRSRCNRPRSAPFSFRKVGRLPCWAKASGWYRPFETFSRQALVAGATGLRRAGRRKTTNPLARRWSGASRRSA
jgi:NAD(P)-dependent dehydrogenase (short-subunit alcohol dehydrogenase family)